MRVCVRVSASVGEKQRYKEMWGVSTPYLEQPNSDFIVGLQPTHFGWRAWWGSALKETGREEMQKMFREDQERMKSLGVQME